MYCKIHPTRVMQMVCGEPMCHDCYEAEHAGDRDHKSRPTVEVYDIYTHRMVTIYADRKRK